MANRPQIDTSRTTAKYRQLVLDLNRKRVLISRLAGSAQERDLSTAPNCDGYGRLRHFRRATGECWPPNPLPMDPACRALGFPRTDAVTAEVFQLAGCGWRCWYCFVPYNLLAAHAQHSAWLTADELLDLYLAEDDRPPIVDLSGGDPGLVPEWQVWMADAIAARGLTSSIYLWSDNALAFDGLGADDRASLLLRLAESPNYGCVGCFKGFDEESFQFNTRAAAGQFGLQLSYFRRLMEAKLDVYAYVTLTTPTSSHLHSRVRGFIDRLQQVHPVLPLRTVPLRIGVWGPVQGRMDQVHQQALQNQSAAADCWAEEMEVRFSAADRQRSITEVRFAA